MKNGILFMPHGNLQYSQLPIEKRAWVAKESYEKIFDIAEKLDIKIAFEASGETLEIVAEQTPDVMKKLVDGIKAGRIEPVASPQTHIMLGNIDPEISYRSLVEGLNTWERLTGVRPVAGWNPECSWASYIPEIYKKAGFEILIADADSYFLSSVEGVREKTGLRFDVRGHSNKNELFKLEDVIANDPSLLAKYTHPGVLPNGLKVILRSDMMCNIMLWYLMGATEGNRPNPVTIEEVREVMGKWQARIADKGGFLMPYAEDAEYVGTTAYFYVKQFGQARFFESEPASVDRFEQILASAKDMGFEFLTPSLAAEKYEAVEINDFDKIENGCAWHGGTSRAWANTPYSRILDPVCRAMYDALKAVAKELGKDIWDDKGMNAVLKSITTAYVSDARWPPAPTSPGRFNVREALDALYKANEQLKKVMEDNGIAHKCGLHSYNIMQTQIAAIDDELMAMKYFEE